MPHPKQRFLLSSLQLTAAIAILALAGCSKKSEPSTQADATTATAATNANPTDQGQAAAPVQAAPSRPLDFKPIQAAVQAKQYDKAAEDLIALQRAPLTPEQSAALQNQMRAFQRSLISAVSSGDPNAQAAIQRLREAAAHH
jgi:PBP1b-binding outer membrane lipoprotein LpoB